VDWIMPHLSALFLVPLTLLPIINPLSSAPVFVATAGRSEHVVRMLARQVAINSWFVLIGSMLVGSHVLALFGISLPIVRIGGGVLVCATAWRMLNRRDDDDVHVAATEEAVDLPEAEIVRRSFFPITFPLTTGPGTIATAIALGAQIPRTPVLYLVGVVVAVAGTAATALVLYYTFRHAGTVLNWLGPIGSLVMMRLIAFILLCIGIQIMWTGWVDLNSLTP
jgi:multiple antibiotic resistance protein